jgi:phosphate transport system permease protein
VRLTSETTVPAAVDQHFGRPLLLTAAQDRRGWILSLIGRALLLTITSASVLAVVLIFYFILKESLAAVQAGVLMEALGSTKWHPTSEPPQFGMLTMVYGSFFVTAGALVIAVPIGIFTAMLLSDIAPFRVREAVKPAIELLAAIPSVAYGFFAMQVFAPVLQNWLGLSTGTNALNAMVMLAVMALPTIISVGEDSLSALGRDLREASYACGATRAETLVRVVLPAAHSGILAAIILGMMRAIGETMLVWMASGNAAQIPSPWWDLTASVRTMTATIAGDMGETAAGSTHRHSLFLLGLMLLAFCFILNLVTEYLMHRVRRSGGKS